MAHIQGVSQLNASGNTVTNRAGVCPVGDSKSSRVDSEELTMCLNGKQEMLV